MELCYIKAQRDRRLDKHIHEICVSPSSFAQVNQNGLWNSWCRNSYYPELMKK